jgi:nitrogen regulatory protein P-II 1
VQLLIAVINQEEKLEEILSGFLEIGVTGATVVNSEGMGRLLATELPIFAGLQELARRTRPRNQMVFSVVSEEKVERVLAMLEEVVGGFDRPATGIAFTIPLGRVLGLKPELADG